jgi:hypothetical protein
MAHMVSTTECTTLLLLLGPYNALQDFARPDFLHPQFFRHSYTLDQCKDVLRALAITVRDIYIFIPHNAVDLTNFFQSPSSPTKRFYLYCETEDIVNQYNRLEPPNICRRVFNANRIEMELYKAAHFHLLRYVDHLEILSDAGDENAADQLPVLGTLLEQSAIMINDYIRQKSGLPAQPAESEET